MRSPLARSLLVALVLLSCRTAPPVRTGAAVTPARAELPRAVSDPSARFFEAYDRAQQGDAGGALERLKALDAAGWAVPLDPADWPALAKLPAFEQLVATTRTRAPRTPHGERAFTIEETGLIPEGITHDPATGTLYVGSIRKRKILRVAPDGTVTDFAPSGAHGLLAPLGLKVDATRGLLWSGSMVSKGMVDAEAAAGATAALFAFDLSTGALRHVVHAPPGEHLLNDLAIAEDGTVYVTDSIPGAVWKLAPGARELTSIVTGGFVYSNGLVLLGDKLVVCDSLGLTIVPLEGGAPRAVSGPEGVPLGGIDGLSLAAPGELVGVQNGLGPARIVRLRFDAGAEHVTAFEVLENDNPDWHIPTTGTVLDRAFVYVGNAHLDGLSAAGLTPVAAAAPTYLFRVALPR